MLAGRKPAGGAGEGSAQYMLAGPGHRQPLARDPPDSEHCDPQPPQLIHSTNPPTCVTMMLLPWSSTTAPACARLASPPSSAAPVIRESWSAWDRRTLTLETRPSPR